MAPRTPWLALTCVLAALAAPGCGGSAVEPAVVVFRDQVEVFVPSVEKLQKDIGPLASAKPPQSDSWKNDLTALEQAENRVFSLAMQGRDLIEKGQPDRAVKFEQGRALYFDFVMQYHGLALTLLAIQRNLGDLLESMDDRTAWETGVVPRGGNRDDVVRRRIEQLQERFDTLALRVCEDRARLARRLHVVGDREHARRAAQAGVELAGSPAIVGVDAFESVAAELKKLAALE